MTGDYSSHNLWDVSYDDVYRSTSNVTNTIKSIMSEKNSTIEIFPVLGNHDVWQPNEEDFEHEY